MPLIAGVALDKASPSYDKIYDYCLTTSAEVGCRVTVPFGNGVVKRLGVILSLKEGDATGLKEIKTVIDDKPLVNNEGLTLVFFLRQTTLCSWYDAFRCQLPPGIGIRLFAGLVAIREREGTFLSNEGAKLYHYLLGKKKITDENTALASIGLAPGHPCAEELVQEGFAKREQLIKKNIADEKSVMARLIDSDTKLSKKQEAVCQLLLDINVASVKELCYFCGVGKSVIETLSKRGVIELYEEIVTSPIEVIEEIERKDILLSEKQQIAFDEILPTLKTGETTLLHGVTGSGKTQVFLKLIDQTLFNRRQALVLIPEIALTPQTAGRFTERFGNRVAVLHSALSMTERLEQYKRIKNGECDIVLGTRSAVFAPLTNIGLIVIDEEQEHTYHSERSPRYHARVIASKRAKIHQSAVLLCSATPSIESYHNAITGKIKLSEIHERFSKNPLPEVEIIDLSTANKASGSTIISERLSEELLYNLEKGQQSILLLNRRGYSSMLRCSSCSEVVKCENCSVSLTYHAQNHRLVCHSCGASLKEPKHCPSCKSVMIRYSGAGTQRAEEELQILFPEARILRMDADSTMSKNSHKQAFDAFLAKEYDIMVGTQMVAKGLDFPEVTLVGVLLADQSLYLEDFRGFERTFSLITQAVGRCGRAENKGRAIIQTFSPENAVLALAAKQDYIAFFNEEIMFRKTALYPPFCNIVEITLSDRNEAKAMEGSVVFAKLFSEIAMKNYSELAIRVLGPAEAMPYKIASKFRMKLLIKCRLSQVSFALFREVYEKYYKMKQTAMLSIDMFG